MARRNTVNIALPPALKGWIDQKVKAEGYETSGEFVRAMLRQAWLAEQQGGEDLEDALLGGLRSGPATPMTDADWTAIRERGRARVAAAKGESRGRRKSA